MDFVKLGIEVPKYMIHKFSNRFISKKNGEIMSKAGLLENPPEMEKLLRKYSGGRITPLLTVEEDEGL